MSELLPFVRSNLMLDKYEYIHVKLEKIERGRSPSFHLAKDGDFTRNHSAALISNINIQFRLKL